VARIHESGKRRVIMSGSTKNIEAFLNALWLEFGLSDNTLAAYGSDLKAVRQMAENKSLLEVCEEGYFKFFVHPV